MLSLITEDAIEETVEYLESIPVTDAVRSFAEEQPNLVAYAIEMFSDVEDEDERTSAQVGLITSMNLTYEFIVSQELIEEEEEEALLEAQIEALQDCGCEECGSEYVAFVPPSFFERLSIVGRSFIHLVKFLFRGYSHSA